MGGLEVRGAKRLRRSVKLRGFSPNEIPGATESWLTLLEDCQFHNGVPATNKIRRWADWGALASTQLKIWPCSTKIDALEPTSGGGFLVWVLRLLVAILLVLWGTRGSDLGSSALIL